MTREEAIKVLIDELNYEVEYEGDSLKGKALKMAISALRKRDVTDKNVGKMTNADRIRAMSDEELVEFIQNIKVRAAFCKAVKDNDAFEELCSAECLKQPAEDDDHA